MYLPTSNLWTIIFFLKLQKRFLTIICVKYAKVWMYNKKCAFLSLNPSTYVVIVIDRQFIYLICWLISNVYIQLSENEKYLCFDNIVPIINFILNSCMLVVCCVLTENVHAIYYLGGYMLVIRINYHQLVVSEN